MVAFSGLRFIFLAVRQVTRPLARQVVTRANVKQGIIYSVCIGLGRVSLGMSGVIAEWAHTEELKRVEREKKAEEEKAKKQIEKSVKHSAAESIKERDGKSATTTTAAAAAAAAAVASVGIAKEFNEKEISPETVRIMRSALRQHDETRLHLEGVSPEAATAAANAIAAAELKIATTASTAAAAAAVAVGESAATSRPLQHTSKTAAASTTTTVAAADASPASTASTASPTATATPAPAPAPEEEKQHVVMLPSLVAPRSRSLLAPITYGPKPEAGDGYDSSVFLDPARTHGEAMRVFVKHPYESAWFVFRTAFLAPFPEKRLVDAGADFLIELVAYTILATLLIIEIRQSSRSAAAKEERANARLDAIEEKVNELVRTSHGAVHADVAELPPAPDLRIAGRLDSIAFLAKSTARLAENYVIDPLTSLATAGGRRNGNNCGSGGAGDASLMEDRAAAAVSGAAAAPVYGKGSRLPKAPPLDPLAKVSKHDETAFMRAELVKALHAEGSENHS